MNFRINWRRLQHIDWRTLHTRIPSSPRWVFAVWLVFAGLAFHALTAGFFGERVGLDYDYFLPWLLSGYYWFMHNGLAIPWFTPAFCAGVPHFPNPQSMYYSVPQFLAFVTDPLTSVKITVWLFAFIGFAGMWLLASLYTRSAAIRLFAALAFAFNNMYMWRMDVGHFALHAFMLLPLVCYLLLRDEEPMKAWIDAILTGALLAYFIHSGASVLVVPVGACLIVVLLAMSKGSWAWQRLGVALAVGVLLSLVKLVAVHYYMAQFPRSLYALPGTDGILSSLELTLRSILWPPDQATISRLVSHRAFLIEPVELNYGIGLAPIYVILACGLDLLVRGWRPRPTWRWLPIGFLLLLPVALDVHSPGWNNLLKSLPYFGNVSSLFRWNLIYLLPAILLAVRLMDLTPGATRTVAPIAALAVIPAALLWVPHYKQLYDPSTIVSAWRSAHESRQVQPVRYLDEFLYQGERVAGVGADDSLTHGASQIVCNEPLFGYRLENFRFDKVYRGGAFAVVDGDYNFYKPQCMIFPDQNQCHKGDRFSKDQEVQLSNLVAYKSIDFTMPFLQRVSIWVSYASLILVIALAIARFLIFVSEVKARMGFGQAEAGIEADE